MANLVNIVLMQLSWFACILGAAHGMPWLGVVVSLSIGAAHLLRATLPRVEFRLMLACVVIGLTLDSAISLAGLVTYTSGELIPGITTPWMLGLWLGFATTLNASLRWLMTRPIIAVLFGLIGGPAAYWSGAQLGALTLNNISALPCIAIEWALAMGLFVTLTSRALRIATSRQAAV